MLPRLGSPRLEFISTDIRQVICNDSQNITTPAVIFSEAHRRSVMRFHVGNAKAVDWSLQRESEWILEPAPYQHGDAAQLPLARFPLIRSPSEWADHQCCS
jgi:hypothetical protein